MEVRRLLIADGSEEFTSALTAALSGTYELRVCSTGTQALEAVHHFQPHMLVLDLMLPGLDGISLLQSEAVQKVKPIVVATCRFVSDYVLEELDRMGVSYVILKPCDIKATAARIMDISHHGQTLGARKPDPKQTLGDVLLEMGFRTRLDGYGYLLEAVLIMAQHPGLSITKELYPEVAQRCNSESALVERSIRSAIASAWKRRDEQMWKRYYGIRGDTSGKAPSNGDFISRLVGNLGRLGILVQG